MLTLAGSQTVKVIVGRGRTSVSSWPIGTPLYSGRAMLDGQPPEWRNNALERSSFACYSAYDTDWFAQLGTALLARRKSKMIQRRDIPAVFTPDNEPYLGIESVLWFDRIICWPMESNVKVACWTRQNSASLSKLQRTACQIIPQGISIALSIRELLRQIVLNDRISSIFSGADAQEAPHRN